MGALHGREGRLVTTIKEFCNMSSREDPRDEGESTQNVNLAELWSELLELREKVELAENKKKSSPKGDSPRLEANREALPRKRTN
jgi:hypothetical protein